MRIATLGVAGLALSLGLSGAAQGQAPVTISFAHHNDLHARVEATMIQRKPYGGYARTVTLLNQLRKQDPELVFLNAGDVFMGTLYFNVYEGLADLALINLMKPKAMTLGNHEFDKGPGAAAAFIKNAQFPVLAANLDLSNEPTLKDIVKPSVVVEVKGQKLGIVGVITDELLSISTPGPTVKMKPLVASAQQAIDDLTKQGVNKIVLLSHCGFREDLELAKQLKNVDLVIGGHSHTPLGTPDIPGWPRAGGTFPTYSTGADGTRVPVFQAWEWGKVMGSFQARFDAEGKLLGIDNAKPIIVDETIPEDPFALTMVEAFKKPIVQLQNQPVGETKVEIPRDRTPSGERIMGNLVADAMLNATSSLGAVAAFTNSGGIRAPIDQGPITYGEVIAVTPFGNTLVMVDLTGDELFRAVQHGVENGGQLIPSKGTGYVVKNGKLDSVTVAGAPLDRAKTYRICFNSFTAGGGDGHEVVKNAKGRRVDTGFVDLDAFIEFIKKNSPLEPKAEGRVRYE